MLPTFVVIGAAKAGTTALYWYLAEHPEIHMSPMKETNFFAYGADQAGRLLYGDPELHRFPVKSLAEYKELFRDAAGAVAVGEASPIYLECPDAARRMVDLIPDARIVCGLRHPVDRAYSDYLMYLRNRGLRFDSERELTTDAGWAQPSSHWMQLGRYHDQLTRYFEVFPREHIHVFLFDDLRRNPLETVQSIYSFLAADPEFVPDLDTPHNVGGLPASMALERFLTSKRIRAAMEPWIPRRVTNLVRRMRTSNLQPAPQLPAELRTTLSSHFSDDIVKTAALIGRDLSGWL